MSFDGRMVAATCARKRILFVSHEATRTGAPIFLLGFLRWLRANTDQEFSILLGRGGALEPEFAKLGKVWTASDLGNGAEILRDVKLIYSNTCCSGALVERLPYGRIPVVTHFHELDFGYDCIGSKDMAYVFRQSTRYIACAQIVARRMCERFGVPETDVSVHYEMIGALPAAADPVAARRFRMQYDISEDAFIIAGCGTVDLRKGVDLFVQIAARVRRLMGSDRKVCALWVGKTKDGEFSAVLRHDIRRLGMDTEIRLLGELPDPNLVIAHADVVCLTSREDPFPLAMIEAAGVGKPVLCFADAGGAVEFCSAGGGITVPFLDVEAMANVCVQLLTDESRRRALGAQAAEVVRSRFLSSTVSPKLWSEIREWISVELPPSRWRQDGAEITDVMRIWNLNQFADRAYIVALLERDDLRVAARMARRAGRIHEAAKLYLQAVASAKAANHLGLLIETLREVGREMLAVNAEHGRILQGEAERLIRQSGYPVGALGVLPRPESKKLKGDGIADAPESVGVAATRALGQAKLETRTAE